MKKEDVWTLYNIQTEEKLAKMCDNVPMIGMIKKYFMK